MPTVYLGTTDFAATVLRRLAASPHRPALVVTRPDRPRGRGRRLSAPPVADAARELGLPVEQPEDVNSRELRSRIAAVRPAAVCICAFGALLREPLLSEHPMLNVHPSLLPRWRGAAPIERAIQAADSETGISIMQPVAELDAGPVYLARREPIHSADTYGSLAERLAAVAGDLLVEALETMPEPRPQHGDPTYAEKIDSADRRLQPARSAQELERTVRALTPHIGAFVDLGEEEGRLGVRAAAAVDEPGPHEGELAVGDGRLLFGTASGTLELLEVQPPGGRRMGAEAYVRGRAGSRSQGAGAGG